MSRVTTTDLLAQAPTGMLAVEFAGEPWVMRGLYNPLKKPACPAGPASSYSGPAASSPDVPELLPQRTRRITEEEQRRRNRPISTEYERFKFALLCVPLCL